MAYSNYYTHESPELPPDETFVGRLRTSVANDYRNYRYRTSRRPALFMGRLAAMAVPPLRWLVDVAFRFLPRRQKGQSGRVLDVGCGGGEWLQLAEEAGWQALGADPDALARKRAAALGFEVRDSIEAWLDYPGSLDVVTMSHVIEHVHDPKGTLDAAFELLRPGGQLFVDTPNIDALGHILYGRDWRGLETPRHLVIFNRRSLTATLRSAGFVKIRYRARLYPFVGMCVASQRMKLGLDPYDETPRPRLVAAPSLWLRLRSAFSVRHAEFLTLTCEKPR
ncbi:MAG: class I SAM-dependent methyltransferase [Sphingomonas sp.]